VDDEAHRRRILAQLNSPEKCHELARKIFHGQRGEIRKHYREGQEDQLGALGLVVNAVCQSCASATHTPPPIENANNGRVSLEPASFPSVLLQLCVADFVSRSAHTDALYDGLYAYLGREVLLPISLIPPP
jgi:Tn3 transposase DDE domain